jgi:hypothetical protein
MIGVARTALRTAWWMAAIPNLLIVIVDGDQSGRRGSERRVEPEVEAAVARHCLRAQFIWHFPTSRGVVRAVEDHRSTFPGHSRPIGNLDPARYGGTRAAAMIAAAGITSDIFAASSATRCA